MQATATTIKTTTLRYTQGSSDKVYRPAIVWSGNGFDVIAHYGRYGGTLLVTTKLTAVPLDQAEKAYDKLIAEKRAKQYEFEPTEATEAEQVEAAPVLTQPSGARSLISVQLLTEVTEAEARILIQRPNIVLQEKMDGHRAVLEVKNGVASRSKRNGEYTPVPRRIVNDAKNLPDVIFDGELIGETLYAFDLLSIGGVEARANPFDDRFAVLKQLLHNVPCSSIVLVPVVDGTPEEKAAFIQAVRERRGEGVVIRDKTAPYTAGRPNRGGSCRKLKFVASASVVVLSHTADKHSVRMGARDENGVMHDLGSVTVAPSAPKPPVGSIIDVQYLYAYPLPDGNLYQPTKPRLRDDIDESACTTAQLKFKGEVAE